MHTAYTTTTSKARYIQLFRGGALIKKKTQQTNQSSTNQIHDNYPRFLQGSLSLDGAPKNRKEKEIGFPKPQPRLNPMSTGQGGRCNRLPCFGLPIGRPSYTSVSVILILHSHPLPLLPFRRNKPYLNIISELATTFAIPKYIVSNSYCSTIYLSTSTATDPASPPAMSANPRKRTSRAFQALPE